MRHKTMFCSKININDNTFVQLFTIWTVMLLVTPNASKQHHNHLGKCARAMACHSHLVKVSVLSSAVDWSPVFPLICSNLGQSLAAATGFS